MHFSQNSATRRSTSGGSAGGLFRADSAGEQMLGERCWRHAVCITSELQLLFFGDGFVVVLLLLLFCCCWWWWWFGLVSREAEEFAFQLYGYRPHIADCLRQHVL